MKCFSVFVFLLVVFDSGTSSYNKPQASKHDKDKSIKYYTKQNTIRIPIMIHLDKALTRIFHNGAKKSIREQFKKRSKAILRNVENIFEQPTLRQNIKFDLIDVKIIKNNTKRVKMDDNVSKYLKSYCEWQRDKKLAKKKWFYSVMFTGVDLYYIDKLGNAERSSIGRGYMKGMCSMKNSCTVLEWHPENIAYMLAHEIAHSLGMSHDGPPYNECRSQRYIMYAKYNPRQQMKYWSPCNKRSFAQYLKSRQSWCLRDSTITPFKYYNKG